MDNTAHQPLFRNTVSIKETINPINSYTFSDQTINFILNSHIVNLNLYCLYTLYFEYISFLTGHMQYVLSSAVYLNEHCSSDSQRTLCNLQLTQKTTLHKVDLFLVKHENPFEQFLAASRIVLLIMNFSSIATGNILREEDFGKTNTIQLPYIKKGQRCFKNLFIAFEPSPIQ